MRNPMVSHALGLVGGVVGGLVGYYVFRWIYGQGFYGLMIPGALLGLGCSLFALHRSFARGVACGVAGVALGFFTEWRFRPFLADNSFSYLVSHFYDLNPITLLMIGLGGVFGFWLGKDANPVWGDAPKPPAGASPDPD